MNKLSSIGTTMLDKSMGTFQAIDREIYKKVIDPKGEKKDVPLGKRLSMAGFSAALSTIGPYGLTKALHKINPKIFNGKISKPLLVLNALSGVTTGYFHPEIRNAILDYHKHKDNEKLKKDLEPYYQSERNIRDQGHSVIKSMDKQAGFNFNLIRGVARGTGKVLSTAGKVVGSGLKFGGKPTLGEKATRFAVKGTILGGAGYGAYKAISYANRPQSSGNYTTFLRNNILAGNINSNEIPDHDKAKINELGMR